MTRKLRRRILKTEIRTRRRNTAGPLKNLIGTGKTVPLKAASVSPGHISTGKMPARADHADYGANNAAYPSHRIEHPEKRDILPVAGGVRSKREIENHDGTVRGGEVSQPDTHTYVNPAKSKTSQEIGRTRKQNQTVFDVK
jgi:hypothetical protein